MAFNLTPNEKSYGERGKKEWKKYKDSIYKGFGGYVEYQAIELPNNTSILFEDKSWTWNETNQ